MKLLKSERGQMTVEMVLLAVLCLAVTLLVSRELREREVMKTLVSGPWAYLRNMNEYGVWQSTAAKSVKLHPNGGARIGTPVGEQF